MTKYKFTFLNFSDGDSLPFLTEVTLDSQMEPNLLESHGHGRVSFGIYVYRQCVLHMVKICVRYFRVRFLWRLAVGKRPQGSD